MSPALSAALDRLLLGARIQEEAGLGKPPKLIRRPRTIRTARRLLDWADRARAAAPQASAMRRMLVSVALVGGLRLATGTCRRFGLRALRSVAATRTRAVDGERPEVGGYVTSSPKEDQMIRISLLLRLMGRPVDAARLLIARLRSPLASPRTRRMLAAWLTQAGEEEAAVALREYDGPEPAARDRGGARPHEPRRLRYAVVVLAMFDSPIFRSSLRSLVESDFEGEIVVVEDGHVETEACRASCEALRVTYVKNPEWSGCAAGLNLGIRRVSDKTDILLCSHSDVLWPPLWFGDLDRAWDSVHDSDRVGLLNLSYLQCTPRLDPALHDLFLERRYDDLLWLLRAVRELPALMDHVQSAQTCPGDEPFGLARDPCVDWVPDLRQQNGRFSVVASFPRRTWQELGGFDPELVFAFDLQLLHHNVKRRRWSLFLNNPPVIHLKSSDIEAISAEQMTRIGTRFMTQTYDGFYRKFGWHIDHYVNLYFSESTVVHRDRIVAAANTRRFDDVDFVFDDFGARLAGRTLDNCELTWCRSRRQCPYGAASDGAASVQLAG